MVESDKHPSLQTSKRAKHPNSLTTVAMPYVWHKVSAATSTCKPSSKKHACEAILCYLVPNHIQATIMQIAHRRTASQTKNTSDVYS